MGELTEWDIEQCNRMIQGNQNAGYLVETSSGKTGRTYHNKPEINGKIQVFCEDGTKLLCTPEKTKLIGFID